MNCNKDVGANQHMSRHVELDIDIGADAKDWSAIQAGERLKPTEAELRRIEEIMAEIVREMDYLREREYKLRDTNESTNERVKWFGIMTMMSLMGLGIWQVLYLRAYFRSVETVSISCSRVLNLVKELANTISGQNISSENRQLALASYIFFGDDITLILIHLVVSNPRLRLHTPPCDWASHQALPFKLYIVKGVASSTSLCGVDAVEYDNSSDCPPGSRDTHAIALSNEIVIRQVYSSLFQHFALREHLRIPMCYSESLLPLPSNVTFASAWIGQLRLLVVVPPSKPQVILHSSTSLTPYLSSLI